MIFAIDEPRPLKEPGGVGFFRSRSDRSFPCIDHEPNNSPVGKNNAVINFPPLKLLRAYPTVDRCCVIEGVLIGLLVVTHEYILSMQISWRVIRSGCHHHDLPIQP